MGKFGNGDKNVISKSWDNSKDFWSRGYWSYNMRYKSSYGHYYSLSKSWSKNI